MGIDVLSDELHILFVFSGIASSFGSVQNEKRWTALECSESPVENSNGAISVSSSFEKSPRG